MRYSDEIIEEVRAANDIVDLVSGYVKLKRQGANHIGLCPFHNEKTPSFSVSRSKQMYYCFGCGAGGSVFTFLMQYENMTFPEAVKQLAERGGITLPKERYSAEQQAAQDRRSRLLEVQKEAGRYFYAMLRSPQGARAMEYLRGRGLDEETIKQFGLGYADKYSNDLYRHMRQKGYDDDLLNESGLFHMDERGAHDKFWNRVMFPIMDAGSRIIGFGGRVMGDGKPKYLNSPETTIFDKSRNLYGLHRARRTRKKSLIVCEGYMDVIAMHQAGFDNAVASLGTALTSGHCALLKRYTNRVLLLYDSDDAGVRAAMRAIPMLREAGIDARRVEMDPYKDPDEFIRKEGAEAFQKRLDAAENGFLYEVRMMERDYDMNDPQGRSDHLAAVAAHLLDLDDEIERNAHLEAVAMRYRIDPEVLRKKVAKLALQYAGKKERREPERIERQRPAQQNGSDAAQRMMLAWYSTYPDLIDALSGEIGPEDFTNPFYRTMAEYLMQQHRSGGISEAALISRFEDEEQQRRAAGVFATMPPPAENDEERRKLLFETICQIRSDHLEQMLGDVSMTDLAALQELTEARRHLDTLRSGELPQISFGTARGQ